MRRMWIWMLPAATAGVLLTGGCKREPVKAGAGTGAPAVARPMRVGPPASQQAEYESRMKLLEDFYDLGTLGEGIATATPDGEMWAKYPSGIMIHELRRTENVLARLGMTVSVAYVGTIPGTGRVFDESDAAHPLVFRMGSRDLVKGFSLALLDMRVGGKRRVYLPPDLAYGEKGASQAGIGPNQPLIFEIELLDATGDAINLTANDFPKFEPLGPPPPSSAPATAPATR